MSKKNIIWLASYPKSGNTWFRVFLTNLFTDSESPANINDLTETSISSSRKIFDDYTGLSSADLTFEEIDRLRPDVYRMQSEESDEFLFKKVHDKYYKIDSSQALFPSEVSKAVIYLIRNPLDVLVSFAYHSSRPLKKMLKLFNNHNYAFCDSKIKQSNQLRQIMGSWSDHVQSWTEQTEIPVHVVRYEDLIEDSFLYFKEAIQFIGIKKSDDQIKKAILKSDFNILSKQEKESGFKEKMIKSKSFFRKGLVGDWENHLNKEIVQDIIENHQLVMRKYNYIDSKNQLTF